MIPSASISAASPGKFDIFSSQGSNLGHKAACTVTSPKLNFVHNGTVLFSLIVDRCTCAVAGLLNSYVYIKYSLAK